MAKALYPVLFIVTLASTAAITQRSQDKTPPLKVGVVNLKRCFDEKRYERMKEVQKESKILQKEARREIRLLRKRVQDIKVQLQGLDPRGTRKAYEQKVVELKQAEIELEIRQKSLERKLLKGLLDLQIGVYDEVCRVATMYAKDKGFDMILRVEEPDLKNANAESVAQRITARVVLYHPGSMDVTDEVIKVLNEEYLKQKAERR